MTNVFASPYALLSLQSDDQQATACFSLDAEAPLFGAHFPGHPILPGVIQLRMVAEAIAAAPMWRQGEKDIVQVANVKYLHIIDPRVHRMVYITVSRRPGAEGCWRYRATLAADGTPDALRFATVSLDMRSTPTEPCAEPS